MSTRLSTCWRSVPCSLLWSRRRARRNRAANNGRLLRNIQFVDGSSLCMNLTDSQSCRRRPDFTAGHPVKATEPASPQMTRVPCTAGAGANREALDDTSQDGGDEGAGQGAGPVESVDLPAPGGLHGRGGVRQRGPRPPRRRPQQPGAPPPQPSMPGPAKPPACAKRWPCRLAIPGHRADRLPRVSSKAFLDI